MMKLTKEVFGKVGCLLFILCASGCTSLMNINKQTKTLQQLATISGVIEIEEPLNGPIIVAAVKISEKTLVNSQKVVDSKGAFRFHLSPGKYSFFLYVDSNNNFKRDYSESLNLYSLHNDQISEIELRESEHRVLKPILFQSNTNIAKAPILIESYKRNKILENIGKVVDLGDPMFSEENRKLGFWYPVDFVENIVGGLLFNKPYQKNKIPVVFIHGALGGPTEFAEIISQLDTEKYQPWFLYYPSGAPLELVSNYLVESLNSLHAKFQFSELQVITHSMGGLIGRSFIKKHQETNQAYDISLFVTINSPLNGMDSAASGIETSPLVIASWVDLATNSKFINSLNQWQFPKSIPYHLFFSYLDGEDGDGTVPLKSQLSLSLQEEAVRIHGFNTSHIGILSEESFFKRLNLIMKQPLKKFY